MWPALPRSSGVTSELLTRASVWLSSASRNVCAQVKAASSKIRGDALLAEFQRPSDAVTAALAAQAQNALSVEGIDDGIAPVLRVGIALGEVVVADGTVTGAGVVLAQRLEQLSRPGGICISSAIREAIPDRVPATYEVAGEFEVKGFEQPVRALFVSRSKAGGSPEGSSRSSAAPPRARRWLLAGAIAVVGVAALAYMLVTEPGLDPANPGDGDVSAPAEPSSPPLNSIAVLPFDNMSGDPEQDYFSDGLSEDITTDLARIPGLFVISRNSSFAYKGQTFDIKDVGRELGVRYVVEGSVRRAGGTVRVTAQLIDATTGAHVWADRMDAELEDLFEVQDRITDTIVGALSVNLAGSNTRGSTPDVGFDAYDLLLRGNQVMGRFTPAAMREARAIYRNVIELESTYARAHANLALAHAQMRYSGGTDDVERTVRLGLAAAERAAALDDSIPQLHLARGSLYGATLRWEDTIEEMQRSIELRPSYADSYLLLAIARTFVGDLEQALEDIKTSQRIDSALLVHGDLGGSARSLPHEGLRTGSGAARGSRGA